MLAGIEAARLRPYHIAIPTEDPKMGMTWSIMRPRYHIIVSGTGFHLDDFRTVVSSGVVKNKIKEDSNYIQVPIQ
jgi:hypothetical protein